VCVCVCLLLKCFMLLQTAESTTIVTDMCGQPPARKHMSRVGQNRIYTPYMTVFLVISLPKIPYINRIYMVLANPTYEPAGADSNVLKCWHLSAPSLDHAGCIITTSVSLCILSLPV